MNLLKSTEFPLKYLYLLNFLMLIVRCDFWIFSNPLKSFRAFSGFVGKNLGKIGEFTNGLSAGYPEQFRLGIIELNMSVSVQRHADIAVTHDILQRLGVHPGLGHIGAKSMPTHMGCDLGQLHTVGLVVLVHSVGHVLLPVQRNHRHIILVQEQKTSVTVDHRLFPGFLSAFNDPAETSGDFIGHRHIADALFCFWCLDHILHFTGSLKLMIHLDPVLVKLDVRYRKTAKLRNAKAGIEQDEEGIVVAAVVLILFYKVEEVTLLLPSDGFTGHRVVHDDRCQFKLEGVLADQIIIHRQLKSRSKHSADGVDGTVALAILLLQLDQPKLCVRKPHLIDPKLSEGIFLQQVGHGLVPGFGVGAHTGLDRQIFLYQFQHGVVTTLGHDVIKQICLDLPFLLTQRQFRLFAFWHPIILIQTPAVHIILLSVLVDVAVTIPPISTLVFSFVENTVAIISSFFRS